MITSKKSLAVAAVFVGAVAFGNAAADDGTKTATSTTTVKAAGTMSPADAGAIVVKIEAATKRVRLLADAATRKGAADILKAQCLSDKLNQLTALGTSAKARAKAMEAAIARGQSDQANHQFRALETMSRRAQQLDAEANQCVGEELGFNGDTKLVTTIDPNMAPDPNTPSFGGGTDFGGNTQVGGSTDLPSIPTPGVSPFR